MSLVIAIQNENEIIIGAESLIWITNEDGLKRKGQSLKKVFKINQHLAIAITGTTLDSTLYYFEKYFAQLNSITHFDKAFEILCQKIKDTTFLINNSEKYRVTIFGFNGNIPKIKSIVIQAGYITDSDESLTNLYFCGENEPVMLAEKLLAGKVIGSTSEEIVNVITAAIRQCIALYPNVLSEPINILKIQEG